MSIYFIYEFDICVASAYNGARTRLENSAVCAGMRKGDGWIGSNATILPGVSVGDWAVVACRQEY